MVLVFHLLLFGNALGVFEEGLERLAMSNEDQTFIWKSQKVFWSCDCSRRGQKALCWWIELGDQRGSTQRLLKISIFQICFIPSLNCRHHPFEQAQLKEYFDKFGEIESVNLKLDPVTGRYLCQLAIGWLTQLFIAWLCDCLIDKLAGIAIKTNE